MNVRTRTAALALAGAPLALALVACGGDDGGDARADDTAPVSAATTSSTDPAVVPPATTTPPTTSTAPSAPSEPAASDDALVAAARTALSAVDGTVFSIDRERDGWDVTVVKADASEWDLTVDAAGTTVVRPPVEDRDDDDADDRADDLAERQRLLADAQVGLTAALTTARTEVPGVDVDAIDLDLDDRGRATWDVQLGEDTADEQEVTVDAVSGEVLRVERDD